MSEGDNGVGKDYSHLYVYSGANKAGMDGIDKEKQAQIIYEMSKDSAFFKRATKLDAETDLKVQAMKKTLAEFKGCVKQHLCESVAQQSLALEARRSFERICCVLDMDMFFAAVEIRDQPQLRDLPVAVGGMSMISTANYVARKYGVRAAMPGFIAKKLCPQLVFVRSNFDKYREVSDQVKDVIREYDPQFSSHSLDEVYFDLTNAARAVWCGQNGFANSSSRHGEEPTSKSDPDLTDAPAAPDGEGDGRLVLEAFIMKTYPLSLHSHFTHIPPAERPSITSLRSIAVSLLQEIRCRITAVTNGLTCSAGIANNFYLAKIGADVNKPNGQYELPPTREDVLRFVSELPTRKVGGIGKVTERMLERLLEIRTMQQVRDHLPELMHTCTPVLFQFLMRTSLGIGSEEGVEGGGEDGEGGAGGASGVKKPYNRKSLGCERTYSAKGISDPQDLYERLHTICASVGEDMVQQDLYAKAVTLKLKNTDFELSTRISTSAAYFRSAEVIEALARPMLDEALPMKVRLMGVSVSKFRHNEATDADPKQRGILCFLKTSGNGSSSSRAAQPDGDRAYEAGTEHAAADEEDLLGHAAMDWQGASGGDIRGLVEEGAGCLSEEDQECEHELVASDAGMVPRSDNSPSKIPVGEPGGIRGAPTGASAGREDSETAPVCRSYVCPVCERTVVGLLYAFNRHLDRCLLGQSDPTAPVESARNSDGALEPTAVLRDRKGEPVKRPVSTARKSGSADTNKRPKTEKLVLGITDYFVAKR